MVRQPTVSMDPDFGRWVTRSTARGYSYLEWERRMPRVHDEYLNCVVYLYRSRHEAEEGINIGGSGFVVGVPAQYLPPPHGFVYVITNKHVIDKGACVVRVNTSDQKFDVIELKKENWSLSSTDDLAIHPLPALDAQRFPIKSIPRKMFVTEDFIESNNYGPGDEVILIGRFINQEGKERNLPTIRFGHISQMPFEPIEYEGTFQQSFLCEIKSIGGFSGSPVFLAPVSNVGRTTDSPPVGEAFLLGVDWAHIQNWEPAIDADGHEIPHIRYPTNTGMMAVVPAWKLNALLDSPFHRRLREMSENNEIKKRKAPAVSRDVKVPLETAPSDIPPSDRERFNALLNAAVQKHELKD
jgi:hypothetical protein